MSAPDDGPRSGTVSEPAGSARLGRAADPSHQRLVRVALFAVLCAIWGSTWLVIKKSLADLPPLTSAAARMTVAALFMVAFARPLQALVRGGASPWWLSFTLALCQFTISFAIIYTCERVLPSGLCAVLWAIYPLVVALLGSLFVAGERLRIAQWVGFVAGFAGIVLLFQTDVRRIGGAAPWAAGLLLVSPVVVAFSTLLIKKHGAGISSVLMNRDGGIL